MKTFSLAAMLLAATALAAFAPNASAIVCTTDHSTCVGNGQCQVDWEPCGVCVDGVVVVGQDCTADAPYYDDVCLGDYRPLDQERPVSQDCFDARTTGTVWFERCTGESYALFVTGKGGPCMQPILP